MAWDAGRRRESYRDFGSETHRDKRVRPGQREGGLILPSSHRQRSVRSIGLPDPHSTAGKVESSYDRRRRLIAERSHGFSVRKRGLSPSPLQSSGGGSVHSPHRRRMPDGGGVRLPAIPSASGGGGMDLSTPVRTFFQELQRDVEVEIPRRRSRGVDKRVTKPLDDLFRGVSRQLIREYRRADDRRDADFSLDPMAVLRDRVGETLRSKVREQVGLNPEQKESLVVALQRRGSSQEEARKEVDAALERIDAQVTSFFESPEWDSWVRAHFE